MYNYLIQQMHKHKISYYKLSKALNRHTPIIFNKLKGKQKMTVQEFLQICNVLKISPEVAIKEINLL